MVDRFQAHQVPLAIVGMGCRLPGADDLHQYWRLLIEGRSAVVELPPDRLDRNLYHDPRVGVRGKTYSTLGAIIGSRTFDRGRLPIDERLARSVDNAHLLMCDVAAAALQHAGYDPFDLKLRNTGVYVGHAQGSGLGGDHTYWSLMEEAAEFLREVPEIGALPPGEQEAVIRELVERVRRDLPRPAADSPDVSASLVAGTISKAFGLSGPYLAINSACASSLQAMLLAARALQLGRIDMAIVGGASDCKGDTLVLFSHAQAMSSTGTRPFDSEADGLVVGEGYAAIVMKTLRRAIDDGDRIWAVVRGLAASSDGKGKSLWAPRKEGQLKAMERAYRDGLAIDQLEYLEAHATATKLGDATELNTLEEILGRHFPPGKRIPVTSVKGNIGHALETAGIAGVLKTVLALQHDTIPPAINIRRHNPNIDWVKAPVHVPTAPVAWPKRADGQPRRAGVNAFGIGGLNMHVVLDEYNDATRRLADVPSAPRSADDEAIAVIGLGCVLPGAENPAAFWNMLCSGKDPKIPVPRDRWRPDVALRGRPEADLDPQSLVGGFITNFEYDWQRHKVPPKQVAQADPLQFMLLEAADQAMQDAGYTDREFPRENVGVVVGTEFGGDFSFQLQCGLRLPELERHIQELLARRGFAADTADQAAKNYATALLRHWPALIDETGSFSTSSLASRIGKTWNLMGGAAAIDAGQVSGLAAVSICADALLARDCDVMICAAGQRRMTWPLYESLMLGGNLAGSAPRSPLDAASRGFVPAEGVVVLLLKRWADARRDGDRVHAIIRGIRAGHDPAHEGHALELAMARTFEGGSKPSDVGVVELDALGQQTLTADEVGAIASVYGADHRRKPVLLSSVIGHIGNAQGASSLVSLLKAILEISKGELPPTVGFETPLPALARHGDCLHVAAGKTAIDVTTADGRRVAAVATCSRGLAYHAVVESGAGVPAGASDSAAPGTAVVPAVAASPAASTPPATTADAVDLAELEKFLINFVVEQTGYPPEVVELDADLEADLGIDSIKKAQMFGELQEYFDVTPTDNLTLDDFPTLRHIVSFLASVPPKSSPTPAADPTPAAPMPAVASGAAALGVDPGASASSWQVCRFGAADLAGLRAVVEAALQDAGVFAGASTRRFTPQDRLRLAIVADTSASLHAKLSTALSQIGNPASRTVLEQQGIFCREACPETRIAFLFAGQGSQYAGMLKQLVADVPAVRAQQQEIDTVMSRLGFPAWAELAWDETSPLGKDVWTTQISILLADLLVLAALRDRNIVPDLVAGHSYGEYPALFAAGAWGLEQAVRVTRRRCESIEGSAGQGGMLATTATPEAIRQLAAHVDGPVYVANHNAPDQTVVGGTLVALGQIEQLLQDALFETRMLPVPSPFHTPLMSDAAERFGRHLAGETFRRPSIPTYSVATNAAIRGAADIGANLVAHLTTPVHYADLVRTLAREAPTVFVEVGPQQALTRLNRRILADEFVGIACDNPARPGVEQLVRVQALLECSGALDRERQPPAPQTADQPARAPSARGRVWRFDATTRRRAKMRQAAEESPHATVPAPAPSRAGQATRPVATPAGSRVAQPAPPPQVLVSARSTSTAVAPAPAPAPARQPTPAPAPASAAVQTAELETFLINFVVEQTGYPPEVVELDAELEADLGIDSIKKAQMFGELQEYFDVTPTADLTLDDFPTLRHIVNFLAEVPQRGVATPSPAAATPSPAAVTAGDVDVIHVRGTPYEMGYQHGAQKKNEIRGLLRRVADLTDSDWRELPIPPAAFHEPEPFFVPEAWQELHGLADAVGVSVGNLAALNLALAAELPEHELADARGSTAGLRTAVMDAVSLPTAVCEMLSPLVLVREPAAGPRRVVATVAGMAATPVPLAMNGAAVVDRATRHEAPRPVPGNEVAPGSRRITVPEPSPAPAFAPRTSDDLVDVPADPHSLRFTLRTVPTPWPDQPPDFPIWKGAVAIHGDNPLATALQARLESGGATVVRLRESSSAEAAAAELARVWEEQPIAHVFLAATRDATPLDRRDPAQWDRMVNERILIPYFICQRQIQLAATAGCLSDCTVAAVVDLGGDFGFSGNVEAPESGFLTGLLKSLLLEIGVMRQHEGFLAKAVDAPRGEPVELLAANICRELAFGSNDYEVAFVGGRRYLQVALPAAAALEASSDVRPGSTWVLSGGARGITAECGMALARRFGLKLHLIGTTTPQAIDPAWRDLDVPGMAQLRTLVMREARQRGEKPTEAWAQVAKAIELDRNMRAFGEANVRVTYHACDVADRPALARVLDEIRRSDGPIEGILHGAGIEQSCRFEKKTPQAVAGTIDAKVQGAYNLMLLTRDDPVRHFIGLGSISGRLGSNGQTDYAAASDMLCKLTGWYRSWRPECHAVAFHFHPWEGVGMASRPETAAMLEASNLRLMPKQTGLAHLVRELYTRPAETEVLVTDLEYHQRYYPKHYQDIARRADLLGAPGSRVPNPAELIAGAAERARVADRHIMRTVDAPLASVDHSIPLPEATFLLGDNAAADALAAALAERGVRVERLPCTDADAACAQLERVFRRTPVRALMLATGRDREADDLHDRPALERRVERGVYLPYHVTRTWFRLTSALDAAGPATLVALTSLGGDFGFTGPVPMPEGGGLAGLLKSIYVEDARFDHARFRVKVIDAPAAEPPDRLADAVCRELISGRPEVEVAWQGGRRRVVATIRKPLEPRPSADLPRGGVWVVTGGARGITAECALELGRRYGLKLHLLGKSPAPQPSAPWRDCSEEQLRSLKAEIVRQATAEGRSPTDDWDRVRKDREIHRSLARFAAAGVRAVYHACDVGDWNDLERTLREIRGQDGPIEGIIHGAGFAKSFRFGTGNAARMRDTISPKVDGTLALMSLTRDDPLLYFVGFGSLSGRFGGNGLADYAAANDMLAKLCGRFRRQRPECQTTCFHWQTWDQVGMALLADGVGITRNAFRMEFIPPAEGVAHLVEELRAGAPEGEVLVTDGYFQKQFYPYAFEAASPPTPSAAAAGPQPASPADPGMPLITAWTPSSEGGVASIAFDPHADPFLAQHRLKQKPFLPGVIGIECLAETVRCAAGREPSELRDICIVNGMMFSADTPLDARVEVAPVADGWRVQLLSEQRDRQGRLIDAARVHVEAFAPRATAPCRIDAEPPGRPPLGWFPHTYPDEGLLVHGPALRLLKECAYQYDGGWGRIVAADAAELAGPRGGRGWVLPTAVLDACLVACGSFLYLQFGGVIEVPYAFERLRWGRVPGAGEECVIRLFFRERGERHSAFDFTLFGRHDEPLVQAVGYRTIRVGGR